MGRHEASLIGIGKNKAIAWDDAIGDYFDAHGNEHYLDKVIEEVFVENVPPKAWIVAGRSRAWASDMNAPKDQWLEKWDFKIIVKT